MPRVTLHFCGFATLRFKLIHAKSHHLRKVDLERLRQRNDFTDFEGYAHPQLFFNPMSRWALAPVFQLLDIRREPGLLPFGTQFVSLEVSDRCAYMPTGFHAVTIFHPLAVS
jgi:hypothetical protein